MKNSDEQIAMKVSIWSVIVNLILSGFKLVAGIVGHSYAMISDAIHSASDVLSTFVVMIGIKISSKQPDEKHKYGHERFESVSAIILALLLGVVGVGIGYSAIEKLISGSYMSLTAPTLIALIAALVSILVKEIMYWATIIVSKKINSQALKADAWHHRSDALSSVGSLIGIAGAMLGLPILDVIASFVISLFIVKVAIDIFVDSIRKMTDESCDKKTEKEILDCVNNVEGVVDVEVLKTRMFGNKIYVDVEICCDSTLSFVNAHQIAENVHNKIETDFPLVKHVSVHFGPCENQQN